MLRILTTLYNALPFIGKCIGTITEQSVRDWRCYVLNDRCTDGSDRLAAGLAKRDDRIVIINHSRKLYHVGAYLHVLSRPEIADDDICITIDGDDWLPDAFVFHRIVQAYADPKVWLTWGSMLIYHGDATWPSDLSQPLRSWDNLRAQGWVTSASAHLESLPVSCHQAGRPLRSRWQFLANGGRPGVHAADARNGRTGACKIPGGQQLCLQ
jgi:glycosyltransferase involved in cell wall biosynthesis